MASLTEQKLVSQKRGKWSEKGVPHKGWACIHIEDLGESAQTCEMCETREIRFVHHMQHQKYPDILRVGCICAGHLEGDLTASKAREKSMRSRAAKKKRWALRKWKVSAKGNQYIEADGYRIILMAQGGNWIYGLVKTSIFGSLPIKYSERAFETEDQAKLASFDAITKLLANT